VLIRRSPGFNPRPCARGDETREAHLPGGLQFQSAPLREGRHMLQVRLGERNGEPSFNPRPCARGDVHLSALSAVMVEVSIRAPARGATPVVATTGARTQSFNPRPCARGDRARRDEGVARGAVSIRAPARGATRPSWSRIPAIHSFNPRPCARGDLLTQACRRARRRVSIRAPARGATGTCRRLSGIGDQFQSAPLREGRRA